LYEGSKDKNQDEFSHNHSCVAKLRDNSLFIFHASNLSLIYDKRQILIFDIMVEKKMRL